MEKTAEKNLRFRYETYRNYFHALDIVTKKAAADSVVEKGILDRLVESQGFSRLRSLEQSADLELAGRMLRNSWSAESAVYLNLTTKDEAAAALSLPWTFVQIYYGLHDIFDCFFSSQSFSNHISKNHRGFQNRYLDFAVNRSCLPGPFGAFYESSSQSVIGFDYDSKRKIIASKWGNGDDAAERVATLLRTTHEDRAKDTHGDVAEKHRKTLNHYKKSISSTSMIHFLYRMRVRTNYRDVDPYIYDLGQRDTVGDFAEHILCVYSSMMMVGEVLVAKTIGQSEYENIASGYRRWVGGAVSPSQYKRRDIIKNATFA